MGRIVSYHAEVRVGWAVIEVSFDDWYDDREALVLLAEACGVVGFEPGWEERIISYVRSGVPFSSGRVLGARIVRVR